MPGTTTVLITVTGPDRPGVSSVLFAALTRHGVGRRRRDPVGEPGGGNQGGRGGAHPPTVVATRVA